MENKNLQNKGNTASGYTLQIPCDLWFRVLFRDNGSVQGNREINAGTELGIIYAPYRASKAFKLLQTPQSPKYVLDGAEERS